MSKPRPHIMASDTEPPALLTPQDTAAMKDAICKSILRTARQFHCYVHTPERVSPGITAKFDRLKLLDQIAEEKGEVDGTYTANAEVFSEIAPEELDHFLKFVADKLEKHVSVHSFKGLADDSLTIPGFYETKSDAQELTREEEFYNSALSVFHNVIAFQGMYVLDPDTFSKGHFMKDTSGGDRQIFFANFRFQNRDGLSKFVDALLPMGTERFSETCPNRPIQ